ncbi:MAG TPA: helix-turn-helix transcriptional regulator, partial [Mycobacteriales bacterium]|nr:helix-turn-helix transcriptional regulator [Mycobacteriales bacterium]
MKIVVDVTPQASAGQSPAAAPRIDVVTLGRRLRHARRGRGLTLADVAGRVGAAASALSLIENGRREPRLSLLQSLSDVLETPLEELLRPEPPSRRASLEIALERAQRDGSFAALGLPPLRPSPRVPTDVLEHVVALHDELRRRDERFAATPEAARRANVELRR